MIFSICKFKVYSPLLLWYNTVKKYQKGLDAEVRTLIALLFICALIGFIIIRIKENPNNEERNAIVRKRYLQTLFSVIGAVILTIGVTSIYNLFQPSENPSYYDTGNVEDMNEEEYQDFLEWKETQN